MSYLVYILFSRNKDKYYVGQTEDIETRISRHNKGHTKSTKYGIPWELVYFEEYSTRSEAVYLAVKRSLQSTD